MTCFTHFARSWVPPPAIPIALATLLAAPLPAMAQAPAAQEPASAPVTTTAGGTTTPASPVTATPEASQPAEVPAAPVPTPWKFLGPVKFTTTLDTYYDYNFNDPASGKNVLRNFDENANEFSFSYFETAFELLPTEKRRVGFRADIGFGPTADWVNSTDPDDGALKYVQQVYASVLAPVGRGMQIDVGKFNTPIGAEPTETAYNWNYSRSLLFAWAAPYYHMGVRAALPVSDTVTVTAFLINGWNNVKDNNNAKTGAAQVAWKVLPSLTLTQAWMGGPEGPTGAVGWRNLYDTVATWTVTPRVSLMANVDIGRDTYEGQTNVWQGVAGYGKFAVLPSWSITPRFEVFEDRDGFATGTAQTLREFTVTSEHTVLKGLSLRLEYRRDWSTEDFFEYKGDQFRSNQSTILLGFVYALASP